MSASIRDDRHVRRGAHRASARAAGGRDRALLDLGLNRGRAARHRGGAGVRDDSARIDDGETDAHRRRLAAGESGGRCERKRCEQCESGAMKKNVHDVV